MQALTSWFAAGAVMAMLLLAIRRDLRGNSVVEAAGVCAICTMFFWNANARMFMHAYEAMHVFYVTFFAIVAIHCAVRAPETGSSRWWSGAIVACIAATFSYGTGISSFAAVAIVAVLRRCGRLPLLSVVLSAFATFLIYYMVLPGAEGVRGHTSGFSFQAAIFFAIARIGAVFAELLRLSVADLGFRAAVSAIAGAVGVAFVSVLSIRQWSRRMPFVESELYGLGLVVFGFVTNALIAISRTGYFFEYPWQVFADRYLFWSSVTWLGVCIYLLPRLVQAHRLKQYAAAIAVILFSLAAVSPARWDNQWAAEVYRASTLAGVAMKLGIGSDAQVREISDSDSATTYRVVDEMRNRNLGMFADKWSMRIGDRIDVGRSPLTVAANTTHYDLGWPVGTSARLIAGELPQTLAAREQEAELWFADSGGTLIGRAAFTNAGSAPGNSLRLGIPTLRGFQGYVVRTGAPAMLVARGQDGVIRELSRLELQK